MNHVDESSTRVESSRRWQGGTEVVVRRFGWCKRRREVVVGVMKMAMQRRYKRPGYGEPGGQCDAVRSL